MIEDGLALDYLMVYCKDDVEAPHDDDKSSCEPLLIEWLVYSVNLDD